MSPVGADFVAPGKRLSWRGSPERIPPPARSASATTRAREANFEKCIFLHSKSGLKRRCASSRSPPRAARLGQVMAEKASGRCRFQSFPDLPWRARGVCWTQSATRHQTSELAEREIRPRGQSQFLDASSGLSLKMSEKCFHPLNHKKLPKRKTTAAPRKIRGGGPNESAVNASRGFFGL